MLEEFPRGGSLGVFLICWLPRRLPSTVEDGVRGEGEERERQVEPELCGGAGLGRGWQWVDWVTAHYVISAGSGLTSRLNCAGDNGNLPGHSTVSLHGIFNAVLIAPRFTFYNCLTIIIFSLSRSRLPYVSIAICYFFFLQRNFLSNNYQYFLTKASLRHARVQSSTSK